MKRRDRKPRKMWMPTFTPAEREGRREPDGPPPFVRAAIARLGRKHEERLLRDADELHRRQRQPCDVTSRREANEIYRQFLNFV